MLTINEKNLIFIKTKKTASTTLEIMLSKFVRESDIVTPLIYEDEEKRYRFYGATPKNYHYIKPLCLNYKTKVFRRVNRKLNYKFYNHIPYQDAIRKLGKKDQKVISIVRHPFEQAISNIKWLMVSREINEVQARNIYFADEFLTNAKILAGIPNDSLILKFEEQNSWRNSIKSYCGLEIDEGHEKIITKKSIGERLNLLEREMDIIKAREKQICELYGL